MASDDWLDTEPTPALPAVVELPVSYADRIALVEAAWPRLSLAQQVFLLALRANNLRVRKTNVQLGKHPNDGAHQAWKAIPEYARVMRIWTAMAAEKALDKDHLLARQDAIVEELLEPKPILYQGSITGYEENNPGAAARANETLMKAAKLLTDKEIEINVGVAINSGPPTLEIKVLPLAEVTEKKDERVAIDAEFTEVPSDDWLDSA